MDPRAREHGALNLHKSGRAYARYAGSPRNISRHRDGSFYRSIERKLVRAEYTAVQFAEPEVTCARTLIKTRAVGEMKFLR